MNLKNCFSEGACRKISATFPVDRLKKIRINVLMVDKENGKETPITNLWQFYEYAFEAGYCTCLNDIADGDITVEKSDNGELSVTHYVRKNTPEKT
ncbi:MAG: hypothetical protein LBG58_11690 [Planctomycetaceae bacterium]|jgi:hypothetical protein|nr:hypothetical protein [Planctomycetaceae bacterium]